MTEMRRSLTLRERKKPPLSSAPKEPVTTSETRTHNTSNASHHHHHLCRPSAASSFNNFPSYCSSSTIRNERDWRGSRQDISPAQPDRYGSSSKDSLPRLFQMWSEQLTPSHTKPAANVGMVPSAESNLRQLRSETATQRNTLDKSRPSPLRIASLCVTGIFSMKKNRFGIPTQKR